MRRSRKLISLLLVLSMLFTCFTTTFASQDLNKFKGTVLENATEVVVTENGDTVSSAYAIIDGKKISIEWNRKINEVILTEESEDNLGMKNFSTKESAVFPIEFDKNLEHSYTVNYDGIDYDIDSAFNKNLQPNIVIPLGVIIGEALLNYLISLALTIVISGEVYALASEIVSELQKKKEYKHYMAILKDEQNGIFNIKKLYIGPAIDTTKGAASALLTGVNVWSTSQAYAKLAAEQATPGGIIGPEIDSYNATQVQAGWDFYWHYHLFGRKGGHSFYGTRVS